VSYPLKPMAQPSPPGFRASGENRDQSNDVLRKFFYLNMPA
jgi:hypothetical protein